MEGVDPLVNLRDIHLPVEGGWWPPAPGWWGLFLLGLIILCIIIFLGVRYWHNTRAKRQAIQRLKAVSFSADSTHRTLSGPIASMLRITKRYAMIKFGREYAASLHGEQWLQFLKKHASNPEAFSTPTVSYLVSLPYIKHDSDVSRTPTQHPKSALSEPLLGDDVVYDAAKKFQSALIQWVKTARYQSEDQPQFEPKSEMHSAEERAVGRQAIENTGR
ncbi:MAG: DUF4381 family protein [Gammaproteobacteria bacterium]|nr:DUF4381 family protein [Gammaproteobacteria bacterium]